jgi:hypothetical protein
MLGFADGWITLAYILSICCAVLCVVYGIVNWNKGAQEEPQQIAEELDWEKRDDDSINGL